VTLASPVIVVGHDGSAQAAQVLSTAVALASQLHARLWLVRAVGLPTHVPEEALHMSPDAFAEHLRGGEERQLRDAIAHVPAALIAGVVVDLASPWQLVCEQGKAQQALMIVIGSHGHGRLDRLLGTTAAKVVDHADRSVLVVRGDPFPVS
jgi:nucleotide-binding universal stress UspA family protein